MYFILALALFYFCDAAFPISGQHYAINVQNQISLGKNGIVYGKVDTESFHRHGWYKLHINTNTNAVSDQQLAYSAGYLEGVLMNEQIFEGFATFALTSGGIMQSSHIQNFVSQQLTFVENNIKTNKTAYWTHIDITLSQLRGIYAGYNANVTIKAHNISWIDFVMFQMEDELGDILQSFSTDEDTPIRSKFDEHCSVLVRVNSNGSSLFASHDTWSGFETMLRVYKYYNFNFAAPMTSATSIGFSGYPGTLVSSDDYYTTHPSNLVVMETTNDVFVQSLYSQFVTTQTVPFWLRIAVANRISKGGAEWARNFGYFNSGTYNNQYQVVDYKLFTPYKPLVNNLLWIVEQIPGYIVSADMTSTLRTQGFWPSYNIPYFPFIYNTSGYPQQFQQFGNEFSYSMCARAQIFRRDAGKVEHMQAMKSIMRYNNYQNDPLSLKDACKQISARCDLNTPWSQNTLNGFSAFGAIDCKVTDNLLLPLQQSEIVCGPTWDDQPPFAWTRQWNSTPHFGTPKLFAFEFHKVANH